MIVMFVLFLIANPFRVAMTKAQNETVNISLSIHLRSVCRESRSQPVARHKSVCLPPLGFASRVCVGRYWHTCEHTFCRGFDRSQGGSNGAVVIELSGDAESLPISSRKVGNHCTQCMRSRRSQLSIHKNLRLPGKLSLRWSFTFIFRKSPLCHRASHSTRRIRLRSYITFNCSRQENCTNQQLSVLVIPRYCRIAQ